MAALQEAIKCNLLTEYKGLEQYKDQSLFQKGRHTLFGAVLDRLKIDPETGHRPSRTTDETWDDIDERIREGGELLCIDNGMRDPLVWSFIPRCLHVDVSRIWDDVGSWKH